MKMWTAVLVGAASAATLSGCTGTISDPIGPAPLTADGSRTDARLRDLAFMRGTWAATDADGRSEEIWSGASGSCIMGAFRMVKPDGSLALYEILSISAESDGVFMRLRHFDARLVAREEKDAPVALRLESVTGTKAIFRKVSGSVSLDTITYESTKPEMLRSEVTFTPESKRKTLTFDMRREAGR